MPTAVRGEALPKEDKPLCRFFIEKESNDDWVDADQEEPFLLPPVPKETFINASYPEEKVLVISKPAYDIDEKYLINFIACPVTRERYTEDLVSSGKVKGC